MNNKECKWFDDLYESEQKTIMAIKRDVNPDIGEPHEYENVMDFFFDIHKSWEYCFHK